VNKPYSVFQLLLTANAVPNSLIPFTLMMEVIRSSEMFAFTRATRGYILEDGILLSRSRDNIKSLMCNLFI
jgi:hypothetical protein